MNKPSNKGEMTMTKKCCGTCKLWERKTGGCGWAIPSLPFWAKWTSLVNDDQTKSWDGENCFAWEERDDSKEVNEVALALMTLERKQICKEPLRWEEYSLLERVRYSAMAMTAIETYQKILDKE
jgi:hypothetical protein